MRLPTMRPATAGRGEADSTDQGGVMVGKLRLFAAFSALLTAVVVVCQSAPPAQHPAC
ncbi:MAG: hypothetical protein QOH94_1199, partial [Mycobacterium sp.]|nr:hypothetical protein [Mycobacterium sp.]